MRSLCCFLVLTAVLLLTSCDSASEAGRTKIAQVSPADSLASTRFQDSEPGTRLLRSNYKTEGGDDDDGDSGLENYEDRGLVPSDVKSALQKVKTKNSVSPAAQNIYDLTKSQLTLIKRVKMFISNVKYKVDTYFRNAYWMTRFAVWLTNKRTPAQMYDRLGVRYTSGPYDKNYRTYINYLRFYEHFRGPAENPLLKFGP